MSAEYHWDGAGAYCLGLPDLWGRDRAATPQGNINQLVEDDTLVLAVLTGLRRLAAHARDRTAAGGNALVRAHLLPSPNLWGVGLEVGALAIHGFAESRSKVPLIGRNAVSDTEASLDDLAEPGPGLVEVAARLVDELGQEFGIPEMGQVTRDGKIRIECWSAPCWESVKGWSGKHGIELLSK